ncbi:response regulator transcription factor [Breznakia pachnodae]|uniref:DNA-binding response OmpR family regulator n=1 Tax=Breznakia pachnodae TaxID=265178 RepID=A0ABU0DYN0_9FIRM|nr:response regulator transcription factor [Breznakia pachnodae]MDQ0359744.1 DNA-binding response OmpR family regulator [Breznakia pachnodae]
MQTITIVEDEQDIREELTILLESSGYNVNAITDFRDVDKQIFELHSDLVLLDVNLPEEDGYTICRKIRKSLQTPIIFITSLNTPMDELKALSLGGDDYITKPYNIPVMMARINRLLLRNQSTQEDTIEVKGSIVHVLKSTIEYEGKTEELTKNELKILTCLARKPGEIVSRADIIEYLWDTQVYIDDNTLSVNITRLREKLDNLGLENLIQTKRGMGYKI